MAEGREPVLATALRVIVVAGCVAAVALVLVGPGGALTGPLPIGRAIFPTGVDSSTLAASALFGAGVAVLVVRRDLTVGVTAVALGGLLIAASAVGAPNQPGQVAPIASAAAAAVPLAL